MHMCWLWWLSKCSHFTQTKTGSNCFSLNSFPPPSLLISFPPTPSIPTSTCPSPRQFFVILNPNTPICTTSWCLPFLLLALPIAPNNLKVPFHFLPHPLLHLPLPFLLYPFFSPLIRTSFLRLLQSFQKMSPHRPSNLSAPIPFTLRRATSDV